MIVWELAWADSGLVVLDEWWSYRGGRLSRFDCIFEFCFKKYNRLLFFLKKYFFSFFSYYIMMENPRPEEEKIIKDIRNIFRVKKE